MRDGASIGAKLVDFEPWAKQSISRWGAQLSNHTEQTAVIPAADKARSRSKLGALDGFMQVMVPDIHQRVYTQYAKGIRTFSEFMVNSRGESFSSGYRSELALY